MEQSSTSQQEIPKHKNALEEKYQKQPKEKKLTDEKEKLPNPTGWRMLVLPFKMREKTKGGIVLRMGPDCYKDKERYPDGPWCKEGDWVMFARYAGSRIKIEDGEIRLLNDDEVLATIKNPEDILHEY